MSDVSSCIYCGKPIFEVDGVWYHKGGDLTGVVRFGDWSHAEVLAAIKDARWWEGPCHAYLEAPPENGRVNLALSTHNEHCDDLRATAEIHAPDERDDQRYMTPCITDGQAWPCRTYREVVIDRLREWGVL